MSKEIEIMVYMQDGRVFKYKVLQEKAREHAHRIINYGWRTVIDGKMEYYPAHQVLKVVFESPNDELGTKYEEKDAIKQ